MPAPDTPLKDAVVNYLHNRENFYDALLARLPDEKLRSRLKADVEPFSSTGPLRDAAQNLAESDDDLLDALRLQDLLKKPGYGAALGKTTISADEALARAQIIEESGVILFSLLVRHFPAQKEILAQELGQRKRALANVIRLEDELRYHRLQLTPSA